MPTAPLLPAESPSPIRRTRDFNLRKLKALDWMQYGEDYYDNYYDNYYYGNSDYQYSDYYNGNSTSEDGNDDYSDYSDYNATTNATTGTGTRRSVSAGPPSASGPWL